MNGPFKLACQYIFYHKYKSLILIASVFLTALLPIAIKILLSQFNEKIVARADDTPAVVGAKGSSLDLSLNAIYFKSGSVDPIKFGELASLRDRGTAQAIPIHAMFTARDYSVVGTSLDYFDFRGHALSQGSFFTTLGDCVVGSKVAEAIGASVGEYIISDRDNVLDLAGQSPLRLNVVGILSDSRSPDDWAIFVDVKTTWIIQGLGHGHQDLSNETEDSGKVLSKTDDKIVASAGVAAYIEVTPDNIDSFHFHGDTSEFPLTSIIAVSQDVKSETILEGKYSGNSNVQFTKPSDDVRELMSLVFRVKQFFDANAILIAISTALLLLLVVLLSLRLRKREMETMFKLGCSKSTIVQLQLAEILIIFFAAAILLGFSVWGLTLFSGDLVESILVRA